jgi:hypothetical protein
VMLRFRDMGSGNRQAQAHNSLFAFHFTGNEIVCGMIQITVGASICSPITFAWLYTFTDLHPGNTWFAAVLGLLIRRAKPLQ